jgi:two-component system, OmpR family, sensor histidine kinase PhoQ
VINSLYLRLNLTAILVLVIFLTVTGAVMDNAYIESARLSLRERMLGQIYQLITVSNLNEGGELVMPLLSDLPYPQLALPNSGLYAFVSSNGSDKLLWGSPSLNKRQTPKPFTLHLGEKRWQEVQMEDGKDYYLLGFGFQRSLKFGNNSYNFHLMTELAPLDKQVYLYRRKLWGGLATTAMLLLVTQILVLRWGLNPLRKVGQELSLIETGERNQIKDDYPREVKQLTDKINILLSQERTRQTRYRNALADLSHSLKTPLAVLLGGLDEPNTLPETVFEQSTRMMHIVERQLQRAGAANTVAALPPLAVFPVADRIITSLSKVYSNKNVSISNLIEPELTILCDEADLIEIIGNLLDNAFKWCHTKIEIQGHQNGQKLSLSVQDDGPGIDIKHIEHILQRGGRADEATPGHGIGLTIVADIVEAYQGLLRIEQSILGGIAVVIDLDCQFRQVT